MCFKNLFLKYNFSQNYSFTLYFILFIILFTEFMNADTKIHELNFNKDSE